MKSEKFNTVIIAEASISIGLGHVSRCANLTNFIDRYDEILFYVINPDKLKIPFTYKARLYECPSLNDVLEHYSGTNNLIVDLVKLNSSIYKALLQSAKRLILLGQRNDFYLNKYTYVINVAEGNGPKPKEVHRRLMEGVKYYIPNPLIENIKKKSSWSKVPDRVLIVFGGTDASFLSKKAFENFSDLGSTIQVDIISNRLNEISQPPGNIRVLSFKNDLIHVLNEYDLVISSPGNLYFECLGIRVPCLAVCQNDRQEEDFRGYPFVYRTELFDMLMTEFLTLYQELISNPPWDHYLPGKGIDKILSLVKSV